MSISQLKQLISPPANPLEVGTTSQWNEFEQTLGLTVPTDYKKFVFTYGTGLLANFYMVYNPFSASPYISFLSVATTVCDNNRESQSFYPDRFPYAYYPKPGGLLPWGRDENGNDYFWATQGAPDSWIVVQDDNRGDGIKTHPTTMTQFLVAILNKRIEPLASNYPKEKDFTFEPYRN